MLRLLIARTLRRVALLGALLLVAAFVTFAMLLPTTHAQQTDSRPRRVVNNNQQPRPTTTTSTTTTSQTAQQPTPTPAPKPQGPTLQVKPSSQATPTPTPTPEGQEIDPNELITVDTNLVNLNVRVIDRNNRPVHDVQQADFRIFEDNVPQEIKFFTREEVPISYGLVVDNSGSMRPLLNQVIDASKTIINSNKQGDETFLVRFIDREKIEVLQDFTPDENALMDALDNLYIEGGQTAIIDATLLSAERVANYKKGNDLNDRRRRALILVTDGEDRDSYYKEAELFARLREMDVQIYVIGFTGELDAQNGGLIRKSTKDKAVNLINKLATETGGRAFFPSSISELPQIAQDITRDLRTQYVIGYYPTNKARDGQFHAIRVAVAGNDKRDKRIAITRTGRIATAGNINAAAPNRNKLTPPERKP